MNFVLSHIYVYIYFKISQFGLGLGFGFCRSWGVHAYLSQSDWHVSTRPQPKVHPTWIGTRIAGPSPKTGPTLGSLPVSCHVIVLKERNSAGWLIRFFFGVEKTCRSPNAYQVNNGNYFRRLAATYQKAYDTHALWAQVVEEEKERIPNWRIFIFLLMNNKKIKRLVSIMVILQFLLYRFAYFTKTVPFSFCLLSVFEA